MVASAESLITQAIAITGCENFGPDGWQHGLHHLLECVANDVRDETVVADIEGIIVKRLVNRLRVEAWYAEHSTEAATPVQRPVVIVGLPRTATTALHFLLANDPQFRYPRMWEALDPCPPPVLETEHEDPRRLSHQAAPNALHIVAVDGPAEDWRFHALTFDHGELTLPVPSHARWWRQATHPTAIPYLDRVLRMLHSHRPPYRWLLKTPAHVFLLEQLVDFYPDVQFVFTHRNPIPTLASTCDVIADSMLLQTPTWTPEPDFGSLLLEHWGDGVRRAMASRARLGEARFVDVGQRELKVDPLAVAERIYGTLGWELTDETRAAMMSWTVSNRDVARPSHDYTLETYGLTADAIEAEFADYLQVYGAYCR